MQVTKFAGLFEPNLSAPLEATFSDLLVGPRNSHVTQKGNSENHTESTRIIRLSRVQLFEPAHGHLPIPNYTAPIWNVVLLRIRSVPIPVQSFCDCINKCLSHRLGTVGILPGNQTTALRHDDTLPPWLISLYILVTAGLIELGLEHKWHKF
jgi:hypothetical protein